VDVAVYCQPGIQGDSMTCRVTEIVVVVGVGAVVNVTIFVPGPVTATSRQALCVASNQAVIPPRLGDEVVP